MQKIVLMKHAFVTDKQATSQRGILIFLFSTSMLLAQLTHVPCVTTD